MKSLYRRYMNWLHTKWPAGQVESLPVVKEDGSTNVPGVYVVGDLAGVPLLKFASHTGALAVQTLVSDATFDRRDQSLEMDGNPVCDVVIIGAGVAGMAAGLEAKKQQLSFEILEASQPFTTIVNFPKAKPIYTYPTEMTPEGDLQFSDQANVKEALLDELLQQSKEAGIATVAAHADRITRRGNVLEVVVSGDDKDKSKQSYFAHRVIVAIGRSGNFRNLDIPGEELEHVYNRLHDPKDFCKKKVVVVGGGDSALETAIAIAGCGGHVTLSYRSAQFNRPKSENIEQLEKLSDKESGVSGLETQGAVRLMMSSKVNEIRAEETLITNHEGIEESISCDATFVLIGREPPLSFFRRSGLHIHGEWRTSSKITFSLFLLFCMFLYSWKSNGRVQQFFACRGWFPFNTPAWFQSLGDTIASSAEQSTHFLYTLKSSMMSANFYYAFAYCVCVVLFGFRRIKRRNTPYVKVQTLTLMAVQCIPMFLLPELLLPWAGQNEWFTDGGSMAWWADQFFERYDMIGVERAYWRAYGFILAWPLFVGNVCTDQPLWGWWIVGFLQTFVLIPSMIYFWGKGAYCGWICSCGALAETMGDTHRQKMPHGPRWNKLNMVGQVIFLAAIVLLILRLLSWAWPGTAFTSIYRGLMSGIPIFNYKWIVDFLLAGIIGVGMYFWFSGRVWCRFACPLAALMHIYARFSRFRIFADKKKCISCNVCTSVCHQGIDVMNFANKGKPMEDPQCVRCSACVQSCPTGVLTFGQIDLRSGNIRRTDTLMASRVQMAELTVRGQRVSY